MFRQSTPGRGNILSPFFSASLSPKWKIHQYMSFLGPFSSLKASKPALLFSVLFSCVWCRTALATVQLYCRGLRENKQVNGYIKYRWATWENGGSGGYAGDLLVYPELSDMNHANGTQGVNYWPKGYASASKCPVEYSVRQISGLSKTVPDEYADATAAKLNALMAATYPNANQIGAISGIDITYGPTYEGGPDEPLISVSEYNIGTRVGNGIVTQDENGRRVVSLADSTGYAPGYEPDGTGGYSPVWYDLTTSTPTKLSSLAGVESVDLTYDTNTQQYNFSAPDYSAQLSAISEQLQAIRSKDYNSDLHVTVESPDVSVSPQVTVNPTVTVPAPEVIVNVPAPEVTVNVPAPEVTVNVPAPEVTVNVTNSGVDVSDKLEADGTLQDIDDSQPQTSAEEQAIIDVYTGWQTGVPGIAAECDIGLDTLIGPIPQMGSSLDVGQFSFGPYDITLSLTQYANIIAWFRAACLACLLLLFGYNLWNIITQSLQV